MTAQPGRPFCKTGGPPNGHMAKNSKNCAFLTEIGPTDPELLSALGRAPCICLEAGPMVCNPAHCKQNFLCERAAGRARRLPKRGCAPAGEGHGGRGWVGCQKS